MGKLRPIAIEIPGEAAIVFCETCQRRMKLRATEHRIRRYYCPQCGMTVKVGRVKRSTLNIRRLPGC